MRAIGFSLLLLSAATIAAACNDDSGSVCPPGYYLESAQALCIPCPQGTPGYEIAQNQPVYVPPTSKTDTGSGGSTGDATVGADAGIGDGGIGADVAMGPSFDVIESPLSHDGEEHDGATGGEGDAVGGADVSGGGDDAGGGPIEPGGDAIGGGPGVDAGTGGNGGGGTMQDPPDSQGCGGCPLGFYCKTLPSGPFCVAGACLSKPPVYTPPAPNNGDTGGADVSTGDATPGTDTGGETPETDVGTPEPGVPGLPTE